MKRNLVLFMIATILMCVFLSSFGADLVFFSSSSLIEKQLRIPVKLNIPITTEITEDLIEDNHEIEFSSYYIDKKEELRGCIQLWNIEDLKSFLEISKEQSAFDYKEYKIADFQYQNHTGFVIASTIALGDKTISGKEYWLKKDNSFQTLRVSFYVDNNFTRRQNRVQSDIISSIQWETIPKVTSLQIDN